MREDGTFGKAQKSKAAPKTSVAPTAAVTNGAAPEVEEEETGPSDMAVDADAGTRCVLPPILPPLAGAAVSPDTSPAPSRHEETNNILFLSNLPDETDDEMLRLLFEEFPGVQDVRLVPNRSDIAFVEFATAAQAGVGMQGLQGFKIDPQHAMTITYAKK